MTAGVPEDRERLVAYQGAFQGDFIPGGGPHLNQASTDRGRLKRSFGWWSPHIVDNHVNLSLCRLTIRGYQTVARCEIDGGICPQCLCALQHVCIAASSN